MQTATIGDLIAGELTRATLLERLEPLMKINQNKYSGHRRGGLLPKLPVLDYGDGLSI